jgi:plasmid stabilization system protein ParE
MALRIKISLRAASQVRKAAEWWAQNRSAAPNAVGADFGEAVALLAEQPGIGARYEGARAPGVRRLFLGRIGYFIYYKAENGTLQVLALWHASREHQPVL